MKTHVLILLAATALLLPAGARLEAQRQTRKVFITAVDQRGAPVLDLTEADFRIREGGMARQITRARLSTEPMRVALIIDSSGAAERALNELRAGLTAFLTTLPPEHEVVFLTIGRQMRIRVPPTLDRQRLLVAAREFSADGGGTVLLDGLREINDRFLRSVEDRWPVMVVVTTDGPERSGTTHDDVYLRFAQDLARRQTTVHTMLLQWGGGPSVAGEVGMNLARNTGGEYDSMLTANLLDDKMKALAEMLAHHHQRMSIAYEIDYTADANDVPRGLEVDLARTDLKVQISVRRPL